MSETPRTDEQAIRIMFGNLDTIVPVEFSRQLETELAEARAEIERLKAATIDASLLREKLAELAHNQWVGWMNYLFSQCEINIHGHCVIPQWANERWHRQVATRYADLSEVEKDSDRNEADRFLAVFSAHISERDKLIEQMREALKIAAPCVKEIFGYHSKDYVEIKAALSAAERGE
jgi:hypothetical protein